MLIFARGWSSDRDGPGQRLIFYLKGCNLRCRYCGNPEGMNPGVELMYYPERKSQVPLAECCGDGSLDCARCRTFECVRVWRHPERELAGEELSVDDVVGLASESRRMFGESGGVTFGGGEPTMQAGELLAAIDRLQAAGMNVTVESNASRPEYLHLVGKVDHLISDCKAVDDARHRILTGVGNAAILEHLRAAASDQKSFLVRVPLIPGFNADEAERERYKVFFAELNARHRKSFGEPLKVQCLRLHHLGEPKYRALRREYPLAGVAEPTVDAAAEFTAAWRDAGVEIVTS